MRESPSSVDRVVLAGTLRERLLCTIRARFPRKSFGYLLSDGDPAVATSFLLFRENLRNEPGWKSEFEARGAYFRQHDDAGFVSSPEEAWEAQKELWATGMTAVGVFHSHRRHPANFSRVDYEMHRRGFEGLWHLIVSMRNPEFPRLQAFAVSSEGVRELPVHSAVSPLARAQRDVRIKAHR